MRCALKVLRSGGFLMGLLAIVTVVFALVLLPIVGCAEVKPPETAPLTVTVKSFDPESSNQELLEGVEVCELDDTTNCRVTNANGEATLVLPLGQDTGYTMDKEGYARWLHPIRMEPDGHQGVFELVSAQRLADQHARLASPYPMRGTGSIVLIAFAQRAGVTFELVAATGKPYYHEGEDGLWNPDLTATTLPWGGGGFTEVTPGDHQINLGGTAQDCIAHPDFGWPSDDANSVRMPVREGYVTLANASCPLF